MIIGRLQSGNGLGDMLMRYITVRTLALDKNLDFGFIGKENFKGKDFMNLDWGKEVPKGQYDLWNEKDVRDENGVDIRSYDPEINFVEDNTIIDGNFEDMKYWWQRHAGIKEWLKVEPLDMPDDLCVINFRGGEYATVPDLFLTKEYWEKAIEKMEMDFWASVPRIRFEVHTDDIKLAAQFFPDYPIIYNDIGLNWRSIRYAKHLILSNSAFGILPALLNENVKEVIAPRYHARRNIKIWARPSCYYPKFTYI